MHRLNLIREFCMSASPSITPSSTKYVYKRRRLPKTSSPLRIPEGFEKIIFTDTFNDDLSNDKLILPDTAKTLYLGHTFNSPISETFNFKNIEHIIIGNKFNKPLSIRIPNVTNILFGQSFNQSLNDITFNNIKKIFLYSKTYNHGITNISLSNIIRDDFTDIIEIHYFSNCVNTMLNVFSIVYNVQFDIYYHNYIDPLLNLLNMYQSYLMSPVIRNVFFMDTHSNKFLFIKNNQLLSYKECVICFEKNNYFKMIEYNCIDCRSKNIFFCKKCFNNISKCIICNTKINRNLFILN